MGKTLIFHLQNKSLETFLPEKDFLFLLFFVYASVHGALIYKLI